jgi:hypothetical protein
MGHFCSDKRMAIPRRSWVRRQNRAPPAEAAEGAEQVLPSGILRKSVARKPQSPTAFKAL